VCLPEGGELEHHEPGVAADLEVSLENVDDRTAQCDAAAVDGVGRCGGRAYLVKAAWSWMSMRKAI